MYNKEKRQVIESFLNKKNKEDFNDLLFLRQWLEHNYPAKMNIIEIFYEDIKNSLYKKDFNESDRDEIINYLKQIIGV